LRDLDISEVAKRSGVPASALRYYEEKGVIASIGRRGLRRLFDPGILDQLAVIGLAQAAGFTLDEITGMFTPAGRPEIDRKMLHAKADELELKIRKLGAMRDGLRHAAQCSAPRHMECPKFQRILRKGAIRGRRAHDEVG
jgi:DNA-binding transcriptional MerR regulator